MSSGILVVGAEAVFQEGGEPAEWKGSVHSDVEYRVAVRLIASNPSLYTVTPSEFFLDGLSSQTVEIIRGPATHRLDKLVVTAIQSEASDDSVPAVFERATSEVQMVECTLPLFTPTPDHPTFNTFTAVPGYKQALAFVDEI